VLFHKTNTETTHRTPHAQKLTKGHNFALKTSFLLKKAASRQPSANTQSDRQLDTFHSVAFV